MSGDMSGQGDGVPRPAQQLNFAQFVRPEQVMSIPGFDQAQKVRYTDALQKLWQNVEKYKPNQNSAEFRNAMSQLSQASQKIRAHVKNFKQGGTPVAPGAGPQVGSSTQSGGQGQPMGISQQPQQQGAMNGMLPQAGGQGQIQSQPAVQPAQNGGFPPLVMQKINSVNWATPAGTVAGTPEAQTRLAQVKQLFGQQVLKELQARDQIQKMAPLIQSYSTRNADTPQDVKNRYAQFRTVVQQAQEVQKRTVAEQDALRQQSQTQDLNKTQQPPQLPQQPTQASPNIPATTQAMNMNAQNRPGTAQSPAPTANAQQPPMQQPQPVQGGQQHPRPSPFNIQQNPNANSAQNQVPGQNTNTASAQSLSHQGAIAAAQAGRTQYQGGSNPPSAGPIPPGSNPSSYNNGNPVRSENQMNNINSNSSKMPIPKHLTTAPITPVQMAPGRPTMAGVGSGPGVQGVMGQPVLQKPPGYTLEGEGEHVLSRKKLDELVRQVTGAEGPGIGLSQDCEEAMLSVADEFIDDVITAACRLAKLRDGATLDIRDIQIILERNYNIRIPGYALDEVRTVRKFHPAPGWTQKMNSIQAAKVMGGKSDV